MIFLIGYRGVGKTTLGQQLATRLGYGFVDTDQVICEKKGKPVRTIVEDFGWDEFRRCEAAALKELSGKGKHVVATGGGAILHRDIWRKLREEATVIWLTAERDVLFRRLAGDSSTVEMRPSLTGQGVYKEMEEVLSKREPLYAETSHLKIDTGKMSVDEAIEFLLVELSSTPGDEE